MGLKKNPNIMFKKIFIKTFGCQMNEYDSNRIFDTVKKIGFKKTDKYEDANCYLSKSLYCAGYYTIKFEKGWVKSFCPKLITVERYQYCGPFKAELEMRTELSRVSK